MVSKKIISYYSKDGKTLIHGMKWSPEDGDIKMILQISHGMLEHIERYDDFANYLAQNGVLVVGNDHLGHGLSILSEEDRGFFSEENGNKIILEDMHQLMTMTQKEYPNIPYFILGHSMGSFLLRQYLTVYDNKDSKINGAIIIGTGLQPYGLVLSGYILTGLLSIFRDWKYRSKFVNNLALGGNNKKFEPARTDFDWLSRDEAVVDEYIKDEKINPIFTINGYNNMFRGMLSLYSNNKLSKMDKNLPIILMSGDEDSVGNCGKNVTKVYEVFKRIGIKDVSYKLYNKYRHEILNELDKKVVYKDILNWMEEKL